MINNDMGYTVRGRFCSALASLILDGLRPYRIQRLILNDIWKVTSSFCQEGTSGVRSILLGISLYTTSILLVYFSIFV